MDTESGWATQKKDDVKTHKEKGRLTYPSTSQGIPEAMRTYLGERL